MTNLAPNESRLFSENQIPSQNCNDISKLSLLMYFSLKVQSVVITTANKKEYCCHAFCASNVLLTTWRVTLDAPNNNNRPLLPFAGRSRHLSSAGKKRRKRSSSAGGWDLSDVDQRTIHRHYEKVEQICRSIIEPPPPPPKCQGNHAFGNTVSIVTSTMWQKSDIVTMLYLYFLPGHRESLSPCDKYWVSWLFCPVPRVVTISDKDCSVIFHTKNILIRNWNKKIYLLPALFTRYVSNSWAGFCWLCFCPFLKLTKTGFGPHRQTSKFPVVEFSVLNQQKPVHELLPHLVEWLTRDPSKMLDSFFLSKNRPIYSNHHECESWFGHSTIDGITSDIRCSHQSWEEFSS